MSRGRLGLLIVLVVVVAMTVAVVSGTLPVRQGVAYDNGPITDPISERPTVSGLALTLQEFVTMPASNPPLTDDPRVRRWARINFLGEVPDRSGRLFVPDLNGKLYLIERGMPHEYLNVGAMFSPDFWTTDGLGSGFGFAAFHPEFAKNGRFYTVHTEAGGALEAKTPHLPAQDRTAVHGVLTEWTAADPSASTFSGTHREVLRIAFGSYIHGIQQIGFNPTATPGHNDYGLLYIAAGDGGGGVNSDDPQKLGIPQGKILRIDPLGTNGAGGGYGIPPTNPFVGRPDTLAEIYAYGLRDPYRFSWDPAEHNRMLLGNMGEHTIESIYQVQAGDNFGWSKREGPFVFKPEDRCHVYPVPEHDEQHGYTYPVIAYGHHPPPGWPCGRDSGHAVIGGFVYRSDKVPELRGKYVFGDGVDGRIFYADADEIHRGTKHLAKIYEFVLLDDTGKQVTMKDLAGDSRVDLRFGSSGDGEFYILSKANGKIWKVTGARPPAAVRRQFASCDIGATTMTDLMKAENWTPVTAKKWQFPGTEAILTEAGVARPGPRRPFEYAILSAGSGFGSVQIDGTVRIDTPVEVRDRDVIIAFGYRSDTEYYYVHLSTDNTIYPHNGIFVVHNADRKRIDDQWNEALSQGAPPAITDAEWHRFRVVQCAGTGEIAVYLDGSHTPLMTAKDTTFRSGRVGFGSFDNIGRLRDLTVTGSAG
ncbi:MAG: PQQ-dependent sugar dehydrogenase [Pseudonocardiaceae bacterium]